MNIWDKVPEGSWPSTFLPQLLDKDKESTVQEVMNACLREWLVCIVPSDLKAVRQLLNNPPSYWKL